MKYTSEKEMFDDLCKRLSAFCSVTKVARCCGDFWFSGVDLFFFGVAHPLDMAWVKPGGRLEISEDKIKAHKDEFQHKGKAYILVCFSGVEPHADMFYLLPGEHAGTANGINQPTFDSLFRLKRLRPSGADAGIGWADADGLAWAVVDGLESGAVDGYVERALRSELTSESDWKISARFADRRAMRLMNAGDGMAVSAGKFIDAVNKNLWIGKKIDDAEMIEYLGGLFFNCAIAADALGVSFDQIQKANIAKLRGE